jgi:hypothetical protein
MPLKLALVCEADADFRTAAELAERVFREEVDWVDADLLRACPLTTGKSAGQGWKRLHTHRDDQKRSAKRALVALTGADREREARCWTEARLELLRQRGEGSGLSQYLDELRGRIVPLFTGRG